MTPTPEDLLAEQLSATRTAAVTQRCAIATRRITLYKRTHDEACFDITMARIRLVRAGYDLRARAPRDGVVMTAQMRDDERRVLVILQVIMTYRNLMAAVNFQRGAELWNERKDVLRDGAAREERKRKREEEAEAEAKKEAEGENEESRMGEGGKKCVEGQADQD